MTTDFDKLKIDFLHGAEDWPDWKVMMLRLLKVRDCHSAILPTYAESFPRPPAADSSATVMSAYEMKKSKYEKEDLVAQFIISSSVEIGIRRMLATCETAYAMWQRLVGLYEQRSGQRLDLLYTKLFNYEKDPNHDIAQHGSALEEIGREIRSEIDGMNLDEVVETIVVNRILNTLPSEFFEFKDTLSIQDRKLPNLIERLRLKEISIKRNNSEMGDAFYAKKFDSKFKNPKPNSSNQTNNKRPVSKPQFQFKCFGCHKVGHMAINCPDEEVRKRSEDRKRKKNPNQNRDNAPTHSLNVEECKVTEEVSCLLCEDSNNEYDDWLLDSGASRHLCNKREWFSSLRPLSMPGAVRVGDARLIYAVGIGDINVRMREGDGWTNWKLCDVWYVPRISRNLLSVSAITNRGYSCLYEKQWASILEDGKRRVTGTKVNGVYRMPIKAVLPSSVCEVNLSESTQLQVWHERLGHQSKRHVIKFLNYEGIDCDQDNEFCVGCVLGKQHRATYKSRPERATEVGELISTDVCGPMQVPSLGGKRYYVLFKDDFSKYRHVYFIKEKSEVPEKAKHFIEFAKTNGHVIKTILSDGGKEYDNSTYKELLANNGIIFRKTAPYTPQQNGGAERENRTIMESARSMVEAKNLTPRLWAEAVDTAVYVLNRSGPTPVDKKTPYELWFGKRAPIDHLKIFGTECYVHVPSQLRRKLDKKSIKGTLVGYHGDRDGYRVLVNFNEIKISKDVIFQGEQPLHESFVKRKISVPRPLNDADSTPVTKEEINDVQDEKSKQEEIQLNDPIGHLLKRQLRNRSNLKKSKWYNDYYTEEKENESDNDVAEINIATTEPNDYNEAMKHEDSAQWKRAMSEEIQSINENNVWKLVDLPKEKKVIKSRWVFRVKNKADGSIDKHKARLVIKGYSQKSGIDYHETFSPVARYDTVRSILSVAAVEGLQLRQFDVQTAFLYGDLEEEIYMEQPEGYTDGTNRVCKLTKSLYGLKQAPRCWNKKFTDVLSKYGLKRSEADPCLFTSVYNGHKLILAIYVDDGLIASTSDEVIMSFLKELEGEFKITSSEVTSFLGMNVKRNDNGSITISQPGYVAKVLEKFNMSSANKVSTPMERSSLEIQTETQLTKAPYREAIGCLMYLSLTSRPDIAYAVNFWAKRVSSPTESDWLGVKRVLRYLIGTKELGLTYHPNESQLEVFSDSDFASSSNRKSISGIVFKYGGAAISWMSKTQSIIAQSTMEAELIASNEATRHAIWIKKLFRDISNYDGTPVIQIDNQSTIKVIMNPELYKSTKHVDIKYLFVREAAQDSLIKVQYVSTNDQAADGLTKPLDRLRSGNVNLLLGMQ